MNKTKPFRGVIRVPNHANEIFHHPLSDSMNKDKNFFKIEEDDFPSLSEVHEKNPKSEKDSSACGASSLMYSSKLKALPLECSSQNRKLENAQNCESKLESVSSKRLSKNEFVSTKTSFNSKSDIWSNKHTQKPAQLNSQSFTRQPSNVVNNVMSSNKHSADLKRNSTFSEVKSGKSESYIGHTSTRTSSRQKSTDNNRTPKNTSGESSTSKKVGHSPKEAHKANNGQSSKSLFGPGMSNAEYSSRFRSEMSYNKGNGRSDFNSQYGIHFEANRSVGSRVGNSQGVQMNRMHNTISGGTSNKGRITSIPGTQMTCNSVKNENCKAGNQTLNVQASLVGPSETKKKKKRKSKLKRQAALQTGKILVLTPEVHSKIVNQSNNSSFQKHQNILTNINDNEEYPELGSAEPKTVKENHATVINVHLIKENPTDLTTFVPETDKENLLVSENSPKNDHLKAATKSDEMGNASVARPEGEKSTIHSNNPITLSLFDMLVTAKPRKKDPEKKDDLLFDNNSTAKVFKKEIIKKSAFQAVNPFASSRPTIKRGKEREKPKVKRPSRMRKLILMERQLKRENLTKKRSETEGDNNEKSLESEEIHLSRDIDEFSDHDNLEICAENLMNHVTNPDNANEADGVDDNLNYEFSELTLDYKDFNLQSASKGLSDFMEESKLINEIFNSGISNPTSSLIRNEDLVDINTVENIILNCSSTIRNLCEKETNFKNNIHDANDTDGNLMENRQETENSFQTCNVIDRKQSQEELTNMIESLLPAIVCTGTESIEILNSDQNTYSAEVKRSSGHPDYSGTNVSNIFSDQERLNATKLMLHSRKFRLYCNHFISKEIDQAVFSLIDDLARFQDRMYQKDPVKAKIKRRLVYGIKEIKKHMKLKKVKCIIIATDIEDIKSEGGLNDSLRELISLAESYHIPCVFSHRRFNLGKVCRKSVPVSCVGIFNYEGSEKNFKKMIELHGDSKHDYMEVTRKLASELTNDQVKELFEAEKESILLLREVSQRIMREKVNFTPEGYNNNEESESLEKSSNIQSKDTILLSQQSEASDLLANDEKSVSFTEENSNDLKKLNESVDNLLQLNDTYINTILVKYKVVKE